MSNNAGSLGCIKEFTELIEGKFFVMILAFIAIPFVPLKHLKVKTHNRGKCL